jgi:hypothetical protein
MAEHVIEAELYRLMASASPAGNASAAIMQPAVHGQLLNSRFVGTPGIVVSFR